jgi:excisionase family DNA binding protein
MRQTANENADDELRLFFTAREVAQLLRTTVKAVYALAERGLLPGVTRLGRRLLFRRAELLDWLRQKSAPSPKGPGR